MKEKKKKLKYVAADVNVVLNELCDIIATSGAESDPSDETPDGTWQ